MWLDLRPPRPRRGRSRHDDEEAPDEEEEEKMQIEVSFEIWPERLATLQRVGNGREEPNTNPQLEVRCSPFEGSSAVWCAGLSRALFFRTQRSLACVARSASSIRSQRCGHCSARDGTPHSPRLRNASALG